MGRPQGSSAAPRMLVLLHCPVSEFDGSRIRISGKFLEEIQQYARWWPGVVRLVADLDPSWSTSFGTVEVEVEALPFEVDVRPHASLDAGVFADGAAVALVGIGHRYHGLTELGRAAGVPIVPVAEYTHATQRTIMELTTGNPLLRVRRRWWLRNEYRRIERSIAVSAGLQCNGTPTYDAYRHLNPRTLIYFDSRVTPDLLASEADQHDRAARLADRAHPLHLVFSGRLDRMKGAHLLPDVAAELRRLGTPFRFSIFGGGELADTLAQRTQAFGLGDVVELRGALPFASGLMAAVRREADLFVCTHPQGDPSCTYVETMACGVPYVGFANEALVGVADRSDAAWLTPVGDPVALARRIAELDGDREALIAASARALAFATQHTFDDTYARRIEHLRGIAQV